MCSYLFVDRPVNFEAIRFKGSGVNESEKASGWEEYVSLLCDPSLTWDDVKWLTSVTKLPVVVKGILTGILNLQLLFTLSF